jgi:NADH-quinone oxidoreductase subunit A
VYNTPHSRNERHFAPSVLRSYLPVLVFLGLGSAVGIAFTTLNRVLGPSKPNEVKSDPYECGLPSDVQRGFRFGISFYLVAMLFILFDVEVIFLYPVAVHLKAAGAFVLGEILVFVALLTVAFVFVWRRGALEWK